MLKAIIIDDESSARQSIKKILEMYLNDIVEVMDTADDLEKGIALIRRLNPNIVFLDISMPKESGLELFNYFTNINFDVVFVTAHQQYAVNAVGLGAAGYLLKPIKPKQLVDIVLKINIRQQNTDNYKNNAQWIYNNCKLLVNHQKGVHIIPYKKIKAIEADGNYCKIYRDNDEPLYVSKTIGSIEENIPKLHFFRTHRSCIANLNYISEIDKEKNIIHLDGIKVPLASANFKNLIEELSRLTNNSN
ncbi:LytR/AlgR family response regulator transcription factor [Plebeiibacterium marinum]|uniref:LytTR family DNA-binding domain-containing protein n=1 Tax=Plebeiibacterium marinum TaxID=2992111 RepID=A0AAE3MGQ5_9BACT|nr:LytTR family DNA-binding domain-containing protein [Plebeiobacterium marinum]MCW3807291.1 LytTR family DNA-binding domain-containing protein [Plebeiobacterium marinum]